MYTLFRNSEMVDPLCYLITALIAVGVLALIMLYSTHKVNKSVLVLNLVVIGFIELISNYYYVNSDSFDVSSEVIGYVERWRDDYNSIDIDKGERKTAWVESQSNMVYSDTNIFSSIISRDILSLYKSVGLVYQGNGGTYSYRGTTPVTSVLFNVRNVLTDRAVYYGGYDQVMTKKTNKIIADEATEYGIYESEYLCGLGYMVSNNILNLDTDKEDPFEVQNEFSNDVVGVGRIFEKVDIEEYLYNPEGCVILSGDKYYANYQNTLNSDSSYARITYAFRVPEDMELYICVKDACQTMCAEYLDELALIEDSTYRSPSEMLYIGSVKKGQIVTLLMNNNTFPGQISTTNVYIYINMLKKTWMQS